MILQILQIQKYTQYFYPILAGLFGFAATAIGSHFFKSSNQYLYIGLGILLFLGCNNILYKLNFNSYRKNGSTITTILVFLTQVTCIGLYKWERVSLRWVCGVALIFVGSVFIEVGKMQKLMGKEKILNSGNMEGKNQ